MKLRSRSGHRLAFQRGESQRRHLLQDALITLHSQIASPAAVWSGSDMKTEKPLLRGRGFARCSSARAGTHCPGRWRPASAAPSASGLDCRTGTDNTAMRPQHIQSESSSLKSCQAQAAACIHVLTPACILLLTDSCMHSLTDTCMHLLTDTCMHLLIN